MFNFSFNEMVPTFDEFCAITNKSRHGPLALPRQDRETWRALQQLLGLDSETCQKMVMGPWVNITSLPRLFSVSEDVVDSRYSAYRENALALCLFAQFLFVGFEGTADAQVVEIVLQVRTHQKNVIPLILGETIRGIRQMAGGQEFMHKGSPLILMAWLREHFRILAPPGPNYTVLRFAERKLAIRFSTQAEWEVFFAKCGTTDINWCPAPWALDLILVRTAGYAHVLLPGLRYTTYYYASRVFRQYGLTQEIPPVLTPFEDSFQLTPETAAALQCSWGPREDRHRGIVLSRQTYQVYLSVEYLTWLDEKLTLSWETLEENRRRILGEDYETGTDLRMREIELAIEDRPQDTMEAYFEGDYYEKRASAIAKKRTREDVIGARKRR